MEGNGNASVDLRAECAARTCAAPGCDGPAEYRAPRSRERLADHMWLCLEHVRAYNKAWDYYAGMSVAEIEAHVRADTTWRRPSWPFGTVHGGERAIPRDPFDLFPGEQSAAHEGAEHLFPAGLAEKQALNVMNLSPPVTAETVKLRYKELVKQLHPDVNGGDRRAEERLKLVNDAYRTLSAARHACFALHPPGIRGLCQLTRATGPMEAGP